MVALKQTWFASRARSAGAGTHWLLVLVPLVAVVAYTSGSASPVELPKMVLVAVSVALALLWYLLTAIQQRQIAARWTPIHWLVAGWVVAIGIAAFLSESRAVSFFGLDDAVAGGMVAAVSLATLFYLLTVLFRSLETRRLMLLAWVSLGLLFGIFNVTKLFGLSLIPVPLANEPWFFLATTSVASASILSACWLLLGLGVLLIRPERWVRIVGSAVAVLNLVLLVSWQVPGVLYATAAALFFFILVGVKHSRYLNPLWLAVPTIALVVVVSGMFVSVGSWFPQSLIAPTTLDFPTSWTIAREGILDQPLFGSGPQTYQWNFHQYRPETYSSGPWWNTVFQTGSSEILTALPTLGIVPLLLLAGVVGWTLIRALRLVWRRQKSIDETWRWNSVATALLLLVAVGGLVVPVGLVVMVAGWTVLAWLVSATSVPSRAAERVPLARTPAVLVGVAFLTVAAAGWLIVMVWTVGRTWLADYYFGQAQAAIAADEDFSAIEGLLQGAIKHNPRDAEYRLALAQGYATEARLRYQAGAEADELRQLTQQTIDQLAAGREQARLFPTYHMQEADIYSLLRPIIQNADALAVVAYGRALAIDDRHPLLWLNRGRAYLLMANAQPADAATYGRQALDDFQRADALRPNEPLTAINTAYAQVLVGQSVAAISKLEELRGAYPDTAEIEVALVAAYRAAEQYDEALAALDRALILEPTSASLLLQRAEIFGLQGNPEQQEQALEAALAIDPENAIAKQRLLELQADTDPESAE